MPSSRLTLDLDESAGRAADWIDRVNDLLDASSVSNLLRALCIAAICADLGVANAEALARRLIEKTGSLPPEALYHSDGTLVILCACIADRCGSVPAPLREFARIAASVLLESQKGARLGSVLPSYLLWKLDLIAEPVSAGALSLNPATLLGGPTSEIREVLTEIENVTLFGTQGCRPPNGLNEVLDAIAVELLQEYDLELACRTARVRRYVDPGESLALRTFRQFVLANQDDDGHFGLFERETDILEKQTGSKVASLALKLPITLACVWSLAELTFDGYRMIRDIGTHPKLGPRP